MVGINVPIPVPMAYYSFGGWNQSLFGDTHMHGTEGVHFYTRGKVVTSRWPTRARRHGPDLGSRPRGFPTHQRLRPSGASTPRPRTSTIEETMADVTPMRIGDELVVADRRRAEVRSPFDGAVVGRGAGRRPRRTSTRPWPSRWPATGPAPCPPTSGPRSSTGPPPLLAERKEEFARSHLRRVGQADQDRPGRGGAGRRHLPLLGRGGPHAHRRDGPASTPARPGSASSASCCGCPIGVVGRDLARSTSRSTWWRTRWRRPSPPAARSCSSRRRPRRSPR